MAGRLSRAGFLLPANIDAVPAQQRFRVHVPLTCSFWGKLYLKQAEVKAYVFRLPSQVAASNTTRLRMGCHPFRLHSKFEASDTRHGQRSLAERERELEQKEKRLAAGNETWPRGQPG